MLLCFETNGDFALCVQVEPRQAVQGPENGSGPAEEGCLHEETGRRGRVVSWTICLNLLAVNKVGSF